MHIFQVLLKKNVGENNKCSLFFLSAILKKFIQGHIVFLFKNLTSVPQFMLTIESILIYNPQKKTELNRVNVIQMQMLLSYQNVLSYITDNLYENNAP